ncbi:MAG: leucine-rich repeat domain-containing protein [Spirochaetales bacterium]|nr:leucine-rich repeat domain-containing protein [Spirochaetales bacterium]
MIKKSILLLLFIIIAPFSFGDPGDSPGDMWFVVPQGVQQGDQLSIEIHVNTGDQKIAAYGIDILIDMRYLKLDHDSGGIDAGPDGFISASSSSGSDLMVISGFDASGTGPGANLYILTVHCIALENGPSLLQLTVDSLMDESAYTIGTPRGFNNCITIGSNGIAGDANQSGELTIVDALLVAQYYTFTKLTTPIDTSVTDVNQDGNIDIVDALLIAQYYVGIIGPLPIIGTPGPPLSPAPTQPGATPTPTQIRVTFPDPGLEAAVRYKLMIPTGEAIYTQDVEDVDSLFFSYENITDLTGMEYFTSLSILYLGNNNISDLTPLAQLTNLTRLDIQDNDMSDLSPLGNLTNLTSLVASGNTISDLAPIASLTHLKTLDLDENNIINLEALTGMTELLTLHLNFNTISDVSPLGHLTQLTELWLASNTIHDVSPLETLTNLTTLRLYINNISDVSCLASLHNLDALALGANNITDVSPLAQLTSLTSLSLYENNISDIHSLISLTSVKYLYLSDNVISDPSPLTELTQIVTLYLSNNPILQRDIDALKNALPDTRVIF